MGLNLVQTHLSSSSFATENGWLQLQATLLALLLLLRLLLVRWQLQTYLEYATILSLYQELYKMGSEIDVLGIRFLFQLRFQRLPLVALELLVPLIWLGILLFLLLSKVFLPPFLDSLAESLMHADSAEAFVRQTTNPLGSQSIHAVLLALKNEGKVMDIATGQQVSKPSLPDAISYRLIHPPTHPPTYTYNR